MATTVSFTPAQAAAQLTRTNIAWTASIGTSAGPVSYGFRDTAPDVSYGSETATFSRVNSAEMTAIGVDEGQILALLVGEVTLAA